MSSLIHLAPFAALLALIYLFLSASVVRMRFRYRIALGVHAADEMQRAVRAHANFGEYVPFTLLLLALVALLGGGAPLLMVLGGLLVLARLSHAYSLLVAEPRTGRFRWRSAGMIANLLIILVCALFLLWQWARISF